ncbi:MAG: hypothetical protein HYX73_09245 [Acidobacteria bacterium]|nr:hypothetical protein [Acidobacteriota bacterium]
MRKLLPALLLLLVFPAVAAATTLLAMYLDDLTSESQTVAYGRVVGARTEWDTAHNWIFTVYTIQPTQYLKGNLGTSFELREPGGERDGIGMIVAGVPQFQVGQESVLFVWTDPKGFHQVIGFEQGAVLIATDSATGTKTATRSIALGSARAAAVVSAGHPSTGRVLPQLLDQIRLSVAKSSQSGSGE